MVKGTSYFVYIGMTESTQEVARVQAQRMVEWASDALDKLSQKGGDLVNSGKLHGM